MQKTQSTQDLVQNTEEMNTKLVNLCRNGQLDEFLCILKATPEVSLDIVDESGWSPLIQAAFGGHLKIVTEIISFQRNSLKAAGKSEGEVKRLLQRKVRFNGSTALHLASAGGHEAIVKLLLNEDRTSIDVADYDLATPLHCAVLTQHFQIASVLLMNGATINKKDIRGKTPLDWAVERNLSDFVSLFSQYEISNASPDFEQETGLDIVNDEELQSKIVDDLCEEQKGMEFAELDQGVLNELKDLNFSNCNAAMHPALMYRSASVDRRDFEFNSCAPQSVHPCHFGQNPQMSHSSTSPAPIPTSVTNHSCPPTHRDTDGIIFESRYLKARCDALEKEVAVNLRQTNEAQNGWRHREAVLLGQIKAQNTEIMDLRRQTHRMRSFLDKLPNSVRQQFQRNENETNRNGVDGQRVHRNFNAEDMAEMPQRGNAGKGKNFKQRRNHKHKKRNNKNNQWKSMEA